MKAIYFFLLFTTGLFAQDLEYLKSKDTLYLIVPKENKSQFNNFTYWSDGNSSQNSYSFTQPDNKHILIMTVNDRQLDTVKRNITVKRKPFLKKNKKSIIDVSFLDQIGLYGFFMELVKGFETWKVVYIIDEKELSGKKMILRRGYIENSSFISM